MRSLILLLTLGAFYLTLSGQFHNRFLMIAGVVCCVAVTLLSRHMKTDDDEVALGAVDASRTSRPGAGDR